MDYFVGAHLGEGGREGGREGGCEEDTVAEGGREGGVLPVSSRK